MSREVKVQFVIDNKFVSNSYTLKELLEAHGEEKILEDMEVCDCSLNESSNVCEGDCVKFSESEITGRRLFADLKDINGKDIYDGDILDSGGKLGYLGELVVVCWSEEELAWVVNTKDNNYRDRLRSCFADKSVVWEVVGNIYENPDKIYNN